MIGQGLDLASVARQFETIFLYKNSELTSLRR